MEGNLSGPKLGLLLSNGCRKGYRSSLNLLDIAVFLISEGDLGLEVVCHGDLVDSGME
jgi:hypothetical protein